MYKKHRYTVQVVTSGAPRLLLSHLLGNLRTLIDEVMEDMAATGEPIHEPIATRSYSGKFVIRVAPKIHRQIALDAAEQQVSLTHLAATRLATTWSRLGELNSRPIHYE